MNSYKSKTYLCPTPQVESEDYDYKGLSILVLRTLCEIQDKVGRYKGEEDIKEMIEECLDTFEDKLHSSGLI